MALYLTQAEQLYKDRRYEEALDIIEEAINMGGSHPDSRLFSDKAAVLERLAQQAYEVAKQGGYAAGKQEEAARRAVAVADSASLTTLVERCMQEIDHYRRGEAHDDSYCLEIFRRALVQRDELAREVLHLRFRDTILGWLRRHPLGKQACQLESEDYYVEVAFERLWRATMSNQGMEFHTLGAALFYLKSCLQGSIIDTIRRHSRFKEVVPPSVTDYPIEEPATEDDYESDIWQVIKKLLPNDRERKLAYLLYRCGLKPIEIVYHRPEEFSDVQEVYRLQRSIVERLMRNRDLIRWSLSDSEL